MTSIYNYIESKKGFGIILLRILAGWRLTSGVWAYALFQKPITEVEGFLEMLHLPAPLVSAYASVYAQFICGILFLLGLWVRPAAAVMIINFIVAIIAAHLHDPIEKSFPAWALFGIAVCLLFQGAGSISLDNIKQQKSNASNY